jgi:SWI/SNF-related matrix-associated actin-dependent regulator 1 of chromatin subfamily A
METAQQVRGGIGLDGVGSHLVLRFRYDPAVVAAVRALPGRVWVAEERIWALPLVPKTVADIRAFLGRWAFDVNPVAAQALDAVGALPHDCGGVLHVDCQPGDPAFVLASLYDEALVEAIKGVPGRAWDGVLKRWWVYPDEGTARGLRAVLQDHGIAATRQAADLLEELGLGRAPTGAPMDAGGSTCQVGDGVDPFGERVLELCAGCHPDLVENLSAALGETVDDYGDLVRIPLGPDTAGAVATALTESRADLRPALREEIARLAAEGRRFDEVEALSRAHDADLFVAGLGGTLHPFQRAAVAYALRTRRTFLADEQGLGKTVEALAAVHAADAFPAVVLCPASLRLNWQREIAHWLPDRAVEILGPTRSPSGRAEISIINYESLHKHLEGLIELQPRGLVFDESHYCKTGKARRTKAARALAHSVPGDALVLLLTGTPVLNRPAELMSQLTLMGRLDDVGGFQRFRHVYSRGLELDRLHRRLRQTCFVRRRKEDVLTQLPAKQRTVVPVEIANRREYERAEVDIVEWLRAQAGREAAFQRSIAHLDPERQRAAIRARGEDAAVRASRAEPLVRLTKLKLLAALGKLPRAIDWIRGFAESEEKLVVFCEHREVGERVIEAFPQGAHLLGRDSPAERQAAVDRFQGDPGCGLIVCSSRVGGVGITLTAASHVAFLELGWNPAVHDQAEDRLHRIGQRGQVTAWYLLAAETIDEKISQLIEDKRALIAATSDGREAERGAVLGELVEWLVAGERPPGDALERMAAAEHEAS